MILWIGLLGLLFFTHIELAKKITHSFQQFRAKWVQVESENIREWILPSIGLGVTSIHFLNNMIVQSALWRTQCWSLRRYLFSLAQIHFSYFIILAVFLLFLEINSLFLISIFISIWFLGRLFFGTFDRSNTRVRRFIEIALGTFLLLYLFEQLFKMTSILLPFLEESGWVFFLAGGSWGSFIGLFVAGFVLGFVFQFQGYSMYLAFIFYLNSQISFMGFLSFVLGEFLYSYFRSFWYLFKARKDYFTVLKTLFYYIGGSFFILFAFFFYLKFELQLFSSYGQPGMQKWYFIGTLIFIIFWFYLTFMIWGHFNFKPSDPDVKLTDENLQLKDLYSLEPEIAGYLRLKLDQRLKKLSDFELELTEETQKKIPLFVIKKFHNEKEILKKILAETVHE